MIFGELFCKHIFEKKEEINTYIRSLFSTEKICSEITFIYMCKKCGKIKKVVV